MVLGLRQPHVATSALHRLLVLLVVSVALVTVWLGHWWAEVVPPLPLELHRTAPGGGPERTVRLRTARGPPTGQQTADGDLWPGPPLPDGLQLTMRKAGSQATPRSTQPDGREPSPTPELRPSQSPAAAAPPDSFSLAMRLPAAAAPAAADPSSQLIRLPANTAPAVPPGTTRTILFWNKFDGRFNGQKPFVGCPQDNCVATHNQSLLAKADAVLFHMRYEVRPLPPHRPHQRFVFVLHEPPTMYPVRQPHYRGVFNLTMTHRHDSDILHDYLSISAGAETTPLPDIRRRPKAVAWLVSHCETASGRELYVDELQRFIDVDVHGKCGPLRCPTPAHGGDRHECYRMVASRYHFYLAFENSQCRDYVTEKLRLSLRYGLVPVVLGDNRTLYEQVAPPGSFIHISDFSGPQELAEHLRYLMTNQTAYSRYFDWRQRFMISKPTTWCNLCRYLHESHPAQYYDDISLWWVDGGACNPDTVIPEPETAEDGQQQGSAVNIDSELLDSTVNIVRRQQDSAVNIIRKQQDGVP